MSISTLAVLSDAAAASGEPPVWMQFAPLVAMALIFWFLILRPQMKRQKDHQAKVSGLKRGDQVLTGGGFVGKVVKVDENYAEVELAPGLKVKAVKSTISDVIPPASNAAND